MDHLGGPLLGIRLKINLNLVRSRNGVYYFRTIIPKHLITLFGCSEFKRSLNTKNPNEAKSLALNLKCIQKKIGIQNWIMLTLVNSQFTKLVDMSFNLNNLDTKNIMSWTAEYSSNTLKVTSDPTIPGDSEQAKNAFIDLYKAINSQNFLPMEHENTHVGTKINDIKKQWLSHIQTTIANPKTIDEYLAKFDLFSLFLKNPEIKSITKKQVSNFLSKLIEGDITGSNIQPTTSNKYICAIESFLRYAQREDHLDANTLLPTSGLRFKKSKNYKQNSYKPFTNDELLKIFNQATLFEYKNERNRSFAPHRLFLPLLGLYTGARIEELCQLSINNIYQYESFDQSSIKEAVWVIDINEEDGRSVKTSASIRKIPLHEKLIFSGLLDYINDIKENFPDETMLFPYLEPDKYGKYSSAPSKWFSSLLQKLGIKKSNKVFHSFRSTFNNTLKINGISEEYRSQLIGHDHDTINSKNYSELLSPTWLNNNVMSKLNYIDLNMHSWRYEKGDFVYSLEKLLEKKHINQAHHMSKKARL